MQDKIEKIGKGSLIQHGNLNQRIYLMKLDKEDGQSIIPEINTLARKNKYTKIFCKVPLEMVPHFVANGFIAEAQIPAFYEGKESVFFMSKFLSSDRLLDIESAHLEILSKLFNEFQPGSTRSLAIQGDADVTEMKAEDCVEMSEVFKKVFESYPFPIHDPEYIKKTMKNGVRYFGVRYNEKLVALASAETDQKSLNAEMTDFATLPEFRGKKYALLLLNSMEKQMKKDGIKTLYTIARLRSIGMNKTFLRLGYQFAGTAIKNTNISGKIESMNIYYKHV